MHIESNGQHEITVEAEDMLGLNKSSIGIPVTMTVIQPPHGIRAMFGRYRSYIVLGAISLAGIALLGILLSGRTNIVLFRRRKEARQRLEDPLTQPVHAVERTVCLCYKKVKDPAAQDHREVTIKASAYRRGACLFDPPHERRRTRQRSTNSACRKGYDFWHRPGTIEARV